MSARFIVTGLLTSLLNLLVHAGIWALVASALALGFLITIVVRWSGAKGVVAGLESGAIFGFLYWAGINFGLYSSSNHFSLPSTLVDLVCSALCMTLSAGFAAWMLNPSEKRVDPARGVRSLAVTR
jgi:hypothetical protein